MCISGKRDLPAGIVRRIIGNNKILGVSVSSVAEAVKAKKDGADYLGVGAMFATETKTNTELVTMNELRDIKICNVFADRCHRRDQPHDDTVLREHGDRWDRCRFSADCREGHH